MHIISYSQSLLTHHCYKLPYPLYSLLFIIGNIAMDSINFASAFNNLDLNILSSNKEEIHVDAKQGNF